MDIEKLKNPRGVTSPKDSLRLTILIVLAIIVVIAYIYFDHQAKIQRQEAELDPDSFVEVPDTLRIPGAKVDPARLAEVKDSEIAERVIKEKEPYLHLIQQAGRLVYGDMELLGVAKADLDEIRSNPPAFRGKPFEIKGSLQWWEEVKDKEKEFSLYRGYITTPDDDYVYFTVLDIPYDIAIGEVIKLQGFFFKLYSFSLLGEDTRVTSFYKIDPVHELDMDLMDTVYDYDILDMAKPFEEKHLFHMLSYVQNLNEEKLSSIEFQEAIPTEIIKKPGDFRGKPVQIMGEIVLLPVERNLGPGGENPLGIKRCYHGILLNYRGGKFGFVYFLTLEKPDWMQKKDLVYLRGFFMRNYAYRTQNENLQPAPLIIASEFEKFILPKDYTITYISIAILGGTILLSIFFLFQMFKDRRQNQQYREKFIARKKKQVADLVEQGVLDKKNNPGSDQP
ncbi:MAG: flagellar basal body-associated FliL family protein [Planctomycetota bacterium]